MKPSDFSYVFPFLSKVGKRECEVIAYDVMKMLSEKGDVFRIPSFDEYIDFYNEEKNISAVHGRGFDIVKDYFVSETKVRSFAGRWEFLENVLVDEVSEEIKNVVIDKAGQSERYMVSKICSELVKKEYKLKKEVRLKVGCRVDLMIRPGIAVEVKKGKQNTKRIESQIKRYAECDNVIAVILVSERGLIHHIDEWCGKPVRYVSLMTNWGVAI